MMFRAFIVLVFLALGAALNVAVAWACQIFSSTVSVELIEAPDPRIVPPARTGSAGSFGARQRAEGFGRTNYWYLAAFQPLQQVRGVRGSDPDLGLFQAGWPMRSLESRSGPGWRPVADNERAWAFKYGGSSTPKWLMDHQLPLYPLWVGFTVNTIFWGGAIPPAAFAFRRIRGVRRRGRGQCTGCGYPLGGVTVCPECGRNAVRIAPNPAPPPEAPRKD